MNSLLRIGVVVTVSCAIGVSHAAAQAKVRVDSDQLDFTELSLEELGKIMVPVVVGASKHAQKITEAPSAVSVVTAEDIQHFGYRTLGDLLRSVRGFYVTSDRAYNFTGLRGVNRPGDFGGRVLIKLRANREPARHLELDTIRLGKPREAYSENGVLHRLEPTPIA
jgi:iron complex outermembrane receptor protein